MVRESVCGINPYQGFNKTRGIPHIQPYSVRWGGIAGCRKNGGIQLIHRAMHNLELR